MQLLPTSWPNIDRQTWMGVIPWLILLAVLAALQHVFNPLPTSFARTIEGLETKTIYARQAAWTVCVGDMVTFSGTEPKRNFIRKVSATEGQAFSLGINGYAIDERTFVAKEDWLVAARAQFGDKALIKVPENHYLIVNSEFGRNLRSNDWAFDVVPRANIHNRVTYVLVSRYFSRIGSRLEPASADC
ncbi:hypothetical protein [uncultured Roseibium sp.]|uniref:hypothetical protein n=1 Tax=uncultured Roseibium sp. TaxID=1936171 RepID=UPI002639A3D0|nr:hypothetical protein [uncultured Roseibium sp.]